MKKYLLIILSVFLFYYISFSQCTLFKSGADFAWCTPCNGAASVLMTGGVPPYTYNWSTGDTIANISGLCAGTYTIIASDNNSCIITDSVTINQLGTTMTLSMIATAASCTTCCDICINPNPSGGCIPYSYTWSPGDPNFPTLCSACPFETFTLTVTDDCGCSLTDSLTTDTVAVGTTGIKPIKQSEINIYPNPASDFIIVETGNSNLTYTATVTDIYDNILLTKTISSKTMKIMTDHFPIGVYFITLQNSKQVLQTTKWIKAP